MRYRLEFHCHTDETSPCGTVPGAELAKLYKDAGYDGIVITDHFFAFPELRAEGADWQDVVDRFLSGYRAAKAAGDKLGLDVFLGAEIRFPGSANDFLIVGLTEEFLRAHERPYALSQAEFFKLADQNGLLLVQAHPFRNGCTPGDPQYLHGAEAYNGHKNQPNHNELAEEFVQKNKLIATTGSDCHYDYAVGTTAMVFAEVPHTTADLVRLLKTGQYTMEKN